MPINPTVVIGVGEAGCKIASDLYSELDEWNAKEEFLRDFEFVGIDTRPEDLDDHTKENFTQIKLENPREYFRGDLPTHPYLKEDNELEPGGGATRQRGVSRYYIERNYDHLWEELDGIFESFFGRDRSGDSDVESNPNVWIVNSFGGGTGSGAFPLLAAMVDKLTRPEVWIGGIGSIPRLERLLQKPDPPADNPAYYINSYTALRELAVLAGYEFRDGLDHDFRTANGDTYPLEIPVYHDAGMLTGNSLEFEEPFFDFYGLMAVPEDATELKELNLIAANTIRYFAEASGLEDFGEALGGGNEILFSLDSQGVRAPVDELDEYIEIHDKHQKAVSERMDVIRDINRLRVNREFLTYSIDLEPGQEPNERPAVNPTILHPETGDKLDEYPGSITNDGEQGSVDIGIDIVEGWEKLGSIYTTADREANAHDLANYTENDFDYSEEQLLERTEVMPGDFEVEGDALARYFFYQNLLDRYRSERADHAFKETFEKSWAENKEYIGQAVDVNVERIGDDPPLERWEKALEPYYDEWISNLEDRYEESKGWFGDGDEEIKQKLDDVRGERDELQTLANDYDRINRGIEVLQTRQSNATTILMDQRQRIESELNNDLNPDKAEMDERVQQHKSVLDKRVSELSEFNPERYMSVPFSDFESLTVELLNDADSIVDLMARNVVSTQDVVRAVAGRIDDLSELIQDRDDFQVDANVSWFFGGLATPDNQSILEGDFNEEVPGYSVDPNADDKDIVDLGSPFHVRMVAFFKNFRLENTSEFGTIHQLYESDERVSKEFNEDEDDQEFVTSRFAYPELFPNDREITAYFGLDVDDTETEPKAED